MAPLIMPTLARRTAAVGLLTGAALLLAGPAQAAPTSQDATWLRAAHQYNLTEIAAGRAAQTRARSATVRSLGAMFVSDHTAGDASLRAAATRLGVSLPSTPNATQRAQLAQAAATSGTAFDALFLSQQTAGHRQALAAGQAELAAGHDVTVLALDRATAPVVQKHLSELLAADAASRPTSVNAGSGGQATGRDERPLGAGVAVLGLALLAGAGTTAVRRSRAAA